MRNAAWFGLGIAVVLTGVTVGAETSLERDCSRIAKEKGKDEQRLKELFKVDWDYAMRDNPETATQVGYPGQNDRWTDESLEAIERRKGEQNFRLKAIESINRAKLKPADQISYDLYKRGVEDAIEGARFKGEYMPLTQLNGVHQNAAETLDVSPRARVTDYQDMIARMNSLPKLVDQNIVLLQKGIETGIPQ